MWLSFLHATSFLQGKISFYYISSLKVMRTEFSSNMEAVGNFSDLSASVFSLTLNIAIN